MNFKKTPQIIEILKIFKNKDKHFSALEIYKKIKGKFPHISFATIYNNLEKLSCLNYIKQTNINPRKSIYESNINFHHHIVCIKCKKIYNYTGKKLKLRIKKFKILSSNLIIESICPKCRK